MAVASGTSPAASEVLAAVGAGDASGVAAAGVGEIEGTDWAAVVSEKRNRKLRLRTIVFIVLTSTRFASDRVSTKHYPVLISGKR